MVDVEMSSADEFDGCLLTVEKYCEKEIADWWFKMYNIFVDCSYDRKWACIQRMPKNI